MKLKPHEKDLLIALLFLILAAVGAPLSAWITIISLAAAAVYGWCAWEELKKDM